MWGHKLPAALAERQERHGEAKRTVLLATREDLEPPVGDGRRRPEY